ncbi:MAG: CpaF family protein [Stellaceae bacterium]
MQTKSPATGATPSFGRRDPSHRPFASIASVEETAIVQSILARLNGAAQQSREGRTAKPQATAKPRRRRLDRETGAAADRGRVVAAVRHAQAAVMKKIDTEAVARLSRSALVEQLNPLVSETLADHGLQLNQVEQRDFVTLLVNDMIGLGPLESLLADDSVTDIMVNGPDHVYVERGGLLEQTSIAFRDDEHVMGIANRIANRVGRRIDETTPSVDARLADGSRVHVIIPPLALKGPTISIRKFAKTAITLDIMVKQRNLSAAMATLLSVAARARLNILISGGTGSGKTTLLNALSQLIDPRERIITIEDAAELRLQQPHVVPLETRLANIEGRGEVTIRELVRNALRMRPDRIIVGEIRGEEAFDMLQAMNTGHDGSLGTIHANKPRDALSRLENMVAMAGVNMPVKALRTQIANAINMIVQVERMRDGIRRVTRISELTGMEGEVIMMHDLYTFEFEELADGEVRGHFASSGLRPHFTPRAQYFGLDKLLAENNK